MQRYLPIFLPLFFLLISCKETLSDNSTKITSTDRAAPLTTMTRQNNEDLAITGLLSKLKTAKLPQKISAEDKLGNCLLNEKEILKTFLYFWPEDVDTMTTQFYTIQKYATTDIYTFIGIEFEMYDAGNYHAVNFCTYNKKSGKMISEIEGLISSEGATDYNDGSIEITKTDNSIRLEMLSNENDSEETEKSIYLLNDKGFFEQKRSPRGRKHSSKSRFSLPYV